jgi:hypothetical protein
LYHKNDIIVYSSLRISAFLGKDSAMKLSLISFGFVAFIAWIGAFLKRKADDRANKVGRKTLERLDESS